jgi:hypothetical protein
MTRNWAHTLHTTARSSTYRAHRVTKFRKDSASLRGIKTVSTPSTLVIWGWTHIYTARYENEHTSHVTTVTAHTTLYLTHLNARVGWWAHTKTFIMCYSLFSFNEFIGHLIFLYLGWIQYFGGHSLYRFFVKLSSKYYFDNNQCKTRTKFSICLISLHSTGLNKIRDGPYVCILRYVTEHIAHHCDKLDTPRVQIH